jgi:hypothetical protein
LEDFMQADIRRKLATAAEVLAFAQAHPDPDPSHVAVVTRLQASVARADALAIQQRDGTADERAATAQRIEGRARMQDQLRHLARVGREALVANPELQGAFTLPSRDGSQKAFLTAARSMLTTAAAQKDLLVGLGLGGSFVDDLGKALAAYDGAASDGLASKLDHIGARADLESKADECMRLVGVLDGLNRVRFRDNQELLAEWESARNVVGPFRPRKKKGEPAAAPSAEPAAGPTPAATPEGGEKAA